MGQLLHELNDLSKWTQGIITLKVKLGLMKRVMLTEFFDMWTLLLPPVVLHRHMRHMRMMMTRMSRIMMTASTTMSPVDVEAE